MSNIKLKDALKNSANVEGINASGENNTKPFYTADSTWNDLFFPVSASKLGSNLKPDYDFTNLGLLFPENDESEKVYIVAQFPHDRQDGSSISPHIHYIQDTAIVPTFVMEYRWYKNGSIVPTYTTIESTGGVFTYTSGDLLQIITFPSIDGTDIDTVSSFMDIILYRKTGDGVTGDILYKQFDIHIQYDTPSGSRTEYTK